MQDKSINGALLALRKQIIRGDLDGLAHVEALLVLRGADLPAVLPAKRQDAAAAGTYGGYGAERPQERRKHAGDACGLCQRQAARDTTRGGL